MRHPKYTRAPIVRRKISQGKDIRADAQKDAALPPGGVPKDPREASIAVKATPIRLKEDGGRERAKRESGTERREIKREREEGIEVRGSKS